MIDAGMKNAEMRLVGQVRREHISREQRLGLEPAGILNRRPDGEIGQVTQGDIPVFTDFSLSDTCDNDVRHQSSFYFIASLPR